MMRNCFKRYDKANSNLDFNSANAASAAGSNNASAAGPPQGQSTSQQPSQSPLIKPSALKSQKSTTLNPSMQNTYILPATTQSRTLQYQQQQKLNLQLKSQGHLAQNTLSSKSTSNILQHSTGNLATAGGIMMTSPDTNAPQKGSNGGGASLHGSLRPESAKKRTSFLMHSQASQGAGANQYHSQGGAQTLGNKHPSHGQSTGGLSINHQYNSEMGPLHHTQTSGKTRKADKNQIGGGSENPSFVTSPPKRGGQTRKPSGKSTKSNRAALSKKQLITHNSSIFPSNGAGSGVLNSHFAHELNKGSQSTANHSIAATQMTSPLLAKINAKNQAQEKSAPSSKHQSFSQPRQPSAKNGSNIGAGGQGTAEQQSTYIIQKNQIDFRKGAGRGGKEATHTPSGISHYSNDAGKAEGKPGLQGSSSVGLLGTNKNGGSLTTKTQNLVEHGAVAAVIPSQQNSTAATSSKNPHSNRSISQGTNPKFLPTIQNNSSQSTIGGNSSSQGGGAPGQSQAMYAATSISPYHSIEEVQQNIPNQPLASSANQHTNLATLQHLANQTPASDYFNLKQSQTTKYGSGQGSGQPGSNMRSTSQPHLHQNNSSTSVVGGKGPGVSQNANGTLHQSSSFMQTSSVVPGNGTAPTGQGSHSTAHMSNLLAKGGLRSQSEPPQPQLKGSDSTASFMENLRQRATFSVVMKAAMLPKQAKRTGDRIGTEAQLASESVKATVTKLLQKNQPQTTLPFFQTSKVSGKAFGSVKAFAANTNVGIVRKANEDRISIILNVIQPAQKQPRIPSDQWPKLQIFGVYDGHGGSKCAEYLKDNLHNNVILQPEFPSNIPEAIRKGSYKTEDDYLKVAAPSQDQPHNKAGSCAIVILVVNDDVYILNVGDSRAIGSRSEHPSDSLIHQKASVALSSQEKLQGTPKMQMEATSHVKQLSDDHKPSCPREFKRIQQAGGYVYQTQTVMKNGLPTTQTQQVRQAVCPEPEDSDDEENPFVGPYRVFPGRLSVCRTFGDCEAKLEYLGGVRGVVTCDPEVTHEVDGVNDLDYVLIGSDGIFDKLKNDTINSIIWDVTTKQRQLAHSQGTTPSVHTISGLVADEVLHASARARSLDNLSVVFVAFRRFKEYIETMQHKEYLAPQPSLPMHLHQDVSSKATPNKSAMLRKDSASKKLAHSNILNQIPANNSDVKTLQRNSNSVYKLDHHHHHGHSNPPFASSSQLHQQPYANSLSMGSSHKSANLQSSTLLSGVSAQSMVSDAVSSSDVAKRGYSANNGPPESGNKTPSSTNAQSNQFYLNKMREQQAKQSAQRHAGMLENINRPSSRQGASRKGMRSRKANGNGLTPNAASHSQDSRPTLPHVQPMKPGTSTSSKQVYNQLSDVKQSNNSSSAANLPSAQALGHGSSQISQSQQNMHGSSSTANLTGANPSSTTQGGYPSGSNGPVQSQQSSRDQQISSAHANRRGGLFKVNTNSNQGPSQGATTQGQNATGANMLPEFLKTNNNGKNASQGASGGAMSANTSQIGGAGANTSNSDARSKNASTSYQSNGVGGAAGSSASATNLRKKMKPYKSNQIRRMPDNSSALPMKFITEAGQGGANGPSGPFKNGGSGRDASQSAFSDSQNNGAGANGHRF